MLIDWSQVKTQEDILSEEAAREQLVITRKQGLFWLIDNLQVTESVVLEAIGAIPDEIERYKAEVSFKTNDWHSDDPYVQLFGASLGLDTPDKLKAAFKAAMEA